MDLREQAALMHDTTMCLQAVLAMSQLHLERLEEITFSFRPPFGEEMQVEFSANMVEPGLPLIGSCFFRDQRLVGRNRWVPNRLMTAGNVFRFTTMPQVSGWHITVDAWQSAPPLRRVVRI